MTLSRPVLAADEVGRIVAAVLGAAEPGAVFALAVSDHHGDLLAFWRTDHCAPHTGSLARAKAYTAARVRMDTAVFAEFLSTRGLSVGDYGDPALVALRGGVVVRDACGSVLGGVGVSGLAPAEDERLARLGHEAID